MESRHAVSPDVDLRNFLGFDCVSPYEEHTARLERGFTLTVWEATDPWEKALVVASRRVRLALENLQSDAQIEDAQSKAKRK